MKRPQQRPPLKCRSGAEVPPPFALDERYPWWLRGAGPVTRGELDQALVKIESARAAVAELTNAYGPRVADAFLREERSQLPKRQQPKPAVRHSPKDRALALVVSMSKVRFPKASTNQIARRIWQVEPKKYSVSELALAKKVARLCAEAENFGGFLGYIVWMHMADLSSVFRPDWPEISDEFDAAIELARGGNGAKNAKSPWSDRIRPEITPVLLAVCDALVDAFDPARQVRQERS